jgi:phosphoribosylanthranilate isomerase
MTTRVKICGINSPAALDAAANAGADWIGYVFFPPSPRAVTPEQAAALDRHRRGPARVGLFVDPRDDDVAQVLAALPLDVLQVHASAERAAALRSRFGVPVWHIVGVGMAADLPASAPGVDGLLLDAKPLPGATRPGGNALVFDWSVLRGWAAPLPWLLAGGLTPGNVAEAARVSGALAVDVSSGVECTRGVKDAGLIRAFVQAVKSIPSA